MKRPLILTALGAVLTGCAAPAAAPLSQAPRSPLDDGGILWVKYAAEYRALTRQAYAEAARDLAGFVADPTWTALPTATDFANKPPAIIFDVDETVVSNIDFQIEHERPFSNAKMERWNRANVSTPVAGAAEFIAAARAAGVELFFVTNRPCRPIAGEAGDCPSEATTLADLAETGVHTDAGHLLMVGEKPDWKREKSVRQDWVAERFRVIMLFGDDLGDFARCVRTEPRAPCTTAATAESRLEAVDRHADRWGHGWYFMPNPMHGSWTSALPDR